MEFRHIIPISGKDSACTAIVQKQLNPDLPYEFVFNDTGAELPPVHDWLRKVATYLEGEIRYVGGDLEEIIYDQGILPSPLVRFCTRMAKIKPLEEYLSTPAYVYYGLRADEMQREGYTRKSDKSPIHPVYPLRQNGINLPMVWTILEHRDLLTPFFEWVSVTKLVKDQIASDFDELTSTLKPWEYRYLFSWRVREFNCSYCFFMRQYEFIGLLENFPDYFWKAVELEESVGAEGYTLLKGNSLRSLAVRSNEIKERRAKEIERILRKRQAFGVVDDLSTTSCGMFCGK